MRNVKVIVFVMGIWKDIKYKFLTSIFLDLVNPVPIIVPEPVHNVVPDPVPIIVPIVHPVPDQVPILYPVPGQVPLYPDVPDDDDDDDDVDYDYPTSDEDEEEDISHDSIIRHGYIFRCFPNYHFLKNFTFLSEGIQSFI